MRKFASFIMSAVVCLSTAVLPTVSAIDFSEIKNISVETADSDIFEYVMVERREIWVTGIKANAEKIVIPESYGGLPVVGINSYAFGNSEFKSSVKSVVIPKTVKYIGEGAFSYCDSIETITISDGVEDIGELAFVGCSSLKTITIPESVKTIGDNAFNGCYNMDEIVVKSPDCDIFCTEYTFQPGTYGSSVITGYEGSSAQKYAEVFTKKFRSLGTCPNDFFVSDFEYPYKKTLIDLMYFGDSTYIEYWIYDIDKDNVPELITKTGTCEADYVISFYKYQNGKAVLFDSMGGGHLSFAVDVDNNQLCYKYAHMGDGCIKWLSSDGNSVSVDKTADVGYDYDKSAYKWSDYGSFETLESSSSSVISHYWENELDMSLIKNYVPAEEKTDIIVPSDKVGNVNGDDVIDANDASVILCVYAMFSTGEISDLSEEQKNTADVNGDGLVNSGDSSAILRYYSYLSTLGDTESPVDIRDYIAS
ncbi:MAG: leucine-rich repeat protein [Ruminococcus flavefaciens]|nr:leucine-rich repeat protein [Ruminococcus flavefaciens]MCM1228682.1 leucine-rich repeat protein [Ruminococcus flavefaciens]